MGMKEEASGDERACGSRRRGGHGKKEAFIRNRR
jgi:hypothetical protein